MNRTIPFRIALILALLAGPALFLRPAQSREIRPPAGAGMVNLPYTFPADAQGNQWMIHNNGMARQQGNMQIYSQAATLTVNGNQAQGQVNQAKVDERSGEIIIENLNAGGFPVTRRILLDQEDGSLRIIDLIKNSQAQDRAANIMIQTHLNHGVNGTAMVPDPKQKGQNMAWVAQTGAGRAVVERFAGQGAKVVPSINWPQGSNQVQANLQMTIPAGKEIAIVHFHATAPSQEAGVKWVSDFDEKKLMRSVSPELRKLIVNFVSRENYIGDEEILRGEMLDVVELLGGDQIQGNLKEESFKLATFYGLVEFPVNRVIGLISVGQVRPSQLLVTSDGQIFGGSLEKQTISLELSSGQIVQIPLGKISRIGYRKQPGEPEEWVFDKPMAMLRSGDRVAVQMPADPFEISTRYGVLQIKPDTIARIVFQSEEHGVHEIHLTDGSRFAGLVNAQQLQMKLGDAAIKLADAGSQQVVNFPVGMIRSLQFSNPPELPEDFATLRLTNEDLLVGTLVGELNLETAFDTLVLNAEQIQKLASSENGSIDVQITMLDQTTVSGPLREQELQCRLDSGLTLRVPVLLAAEYLQPQPQPSEMMRTKIESLVVELNADDWRQRDRAQAQLVSLGAAVKGMLKKLRPDQPAEAQQRIDVILKQLENKSPIHSSPAMNNDS